LVAAPEETAQPGLRRSTRPTLLGHASPLASSRLPRSRYGRDGGFPYRFRTVLEITLILVNVRESEPFEKALRRFRRKVEREGIRKDIKKNSFYLKPGEKRRLKQRLAEKRRRKAMRRAMKKAQRS
jgi:small subunit ribosomal protein S21